MYLQKNFLLYDVRRPAFIVPNSSDLLIPPQSDETNDFEGDIYYLGIIFLEICTLSDIRSIMTLKDHDQIVQNVTTLFSKTPYEDPLLKLCLSMISYESSNRPHLLEVENILLKLEKDFFKKP